MGCEDVICPICLLLSDLELIALLVTVEPSEAQARDAEGTIMLVIQEKEGRSRSRDSHL